MYRRDLRLQPLLLMQRIIERNATRIRLDGLLLD